MRTMLQDLPYGLHPVRNSPGFTAFRLLTLGVGIGTHTPIYGVLDPAVLRLPPVLKRLMVLRFPGDITDSLVVSFASFAAGYISVRCTTQVDSIAGLRGE